MRICQNAFLKLIQPIGRNRLNGVIARYSKQQTSANEGRGGVRVNKQNLERKSRMREFIGKLRAKESHYGRNKSVRLYLPVGLKSVQNLVKLYNTSVEQKFKCSYSLFSRVFRRDFNLGFSSPASDTCTTCDNLRNKLRFCQPTERVTLQMQLTVHKVRAKAFYDLLKNKKDNVYSIVYDLQQVHSLPRVTCQEAFYSRQLSLYNFGLCDQNLMSMKNSNCYYCYTWTEYEAARGANEIASAVNHYLKTNIESSKLFTEDNNIDTVRLVSDGCGGQNKNNIVVGMVVNWLANAPAKIKSVELLFPVRGHSFLPCDRLFGRIEKDLKKCNQILDPKEFHTVFSQHCERIFVFGDEWFCNDWKTATSSVYKPLKNIQDAKRIIATRTVTGQSVTIDVRCEASYKSDIAAPVNILKKGQKHGNLNLARCPSDKSINSAKLKDIHNLLRLVLGENWKSLPGVEVYLNLKASPYIKDDSLPAKDCECADEDIAFRI